MAGRKFFRPVNAAPGLSLNVDVSALPNEIAAVSNEFTVAALEPFVPIR